MSKYLPGNLDEQLIDNLLIKASEHDYRHVDADLLDAFISGGLSEFRKFVFAYNKNKENYEKLAVLLRGNSNQIVIYLNNHKLWELSCRKSKKGSMGVVDVKVSFDFDHARYCSDWSEILDHLLKPVEDGGEYGFKLPDRQNREKISGVDPRLLLIFDSNKNVSGGSVGDISCTRNSFTDAFVSGTFAVFSKLIWDFFKPQKMDYFRNRVADDPKLSYLKAKQGNGNKVLLEKKWQHRLFFEFKNLQDGFYVYDLEFSQPYPDEKDIYAVTGKKGCAKEGITAKSIKEQVLVNEPDMLAIRFCGGKPQALVLMEVKCTSDACSGKSGIQKHINGMDAYSRNPIFIRSRLRDAQKCMEQYQKIGFIPESYKIPDFSELPVEKVFILTVEQKGNRGTGGCWILF